jgi:transcriptional regulator with XRE-family HTH domain
LPRQPKPKAQGKGKQLAELRESLGTKERPYTQRRLADALGVEQSAVARWEKWESGSEYGPSKDVLLKFGYLLAGWPGNKYDNEAIKLLEMAGALKKGGAEASTDAIRGLLDRERSKKTGPQRAEPGEVIKVPLVEVSAEGVFVEAEATRDIPDWLLQGHDPASIICARPSWGLFPFNGILVIDQWAKDYWELVEQGALVAVRFTRYPQRLGVDEREVKQQTLVASTERVTQLEKDESMRREFFEQHSGLTAAERAASEGKQRAHESELVKRLPPNERGTIQLQHIQAGWLRLELANHPDFAVHSPREFWPARDGGPWRLVLQGARVAGVGGGSAVRLTAWDDKSDWQDHPPLRLIDSRILGRVISWMSGDLA